jgi:hypothetical protein
MARIKAAFSLFGFIRVHPFHPWLKSSRPLPRQALGQLRFLSLSFASWFPAQIRLFIDSWLFGF